MRIVSWMVVVGSLAALSWLGLSPVVSRFELSGVDNGQAIGSVLAPAPQGGAEALAANAPDDPDCQAEGKARPGDHAAPARPGSPDEDEPARRKSGCPKQ